MPINSILTEQTTAATDALLALAAGVGSVVLLRQRQQTPWKAMVWSGMFAAVALAGGLGAFAHGLELDPRIRSLLWHPLNAALGLSVALFGAGAVFDQWGQRTAKVALPVAIAFGPAFFLVTLTCSKGFILFVFYETAVMLFCCYVYGAAVFQRRLPGARWMALGVLLTIIAAAVQAQRKLLIDVVWPFDHNGLFHLAQMLGLCCLAVGLRRGLSTPHPDAPAQELVSV